MSHERIIRVEDEATFLKKEGAEALSNDPIFIGPGVGESGGRSFSAITDELTESGHPVFTHKHPNPRENNKRELRKSLKAAKMKAKELYKDKINPKHLKVLLNGIPLTVYREAEAFIRLVEEKAPRDNEGNIIPVRAAGHSHGGLYVLVATFLRPDLFKQVVMMNPAGWSGKELNKNKRALRASEVIKKRKQENSDSVWKKISDRKLKHATKIIWNYTWEVFKPQGKKGEDGKTWKHYKAIALEALQYTAVERKFIGTMKEGYGMANMDAALYAEAVHNYGIKTALIYDSTDSIFPAEEIKKRTGDASDSLDIIVPTKEHSHYGPVTHPKKFAEMLSDIFSAFDNEPNDDEEVQNAA